MVYNFVSSSVQLSVYFLYFNKPVYFTCSKLISPLECAIVFPITRVMLLCNIVHSLTSEAIMIRMGNRRFHYMHVPELEKILYR